jgi:hypothetical protein
LRKPKKNKRNNKIRDTPSVKEIKQINIVNAYLIKAKITMKVVAAKMELLR